MPRLLDPLCGAIGVALFALVVYAGFAGTQTAATNIAPTFVFVVFWVGLAILSLLFGDVFKAFNPWRAIARAVAGDRATVSRRRAAGADGLPGARSAAGRRRSGSSPSPGSSSSTPAAATRATSRSLALVYAAVQLVGMSLYGIEPWNRYGDAFGVYFGLFARISPLRWTRAALLPAPAAQRPDDARRRCPARSRCCAR